MPENGSRTPEGLEDFEGSFAASFLLRPHGRADNEHEHSDRNQTEQSDEDKARRASYRGHRYC
jgi:hypothetical protein